MMMLLLPMTMAVEVEAVAEMNIQMRTMADELHVDFLLKYQLSSISCCYCCLSYRNQFVLPIAACNSPGELNCNFSHSYGYKYFMYLDE